MRVTRDMDGSATTIPVATARALICIAVVVLLAGPWIFDATQMKLLTEFFCVLVLATMWNLLAGYADIVSVGQHAFVGAGSYAFFGFTMNAHLSPVVALALSALCALGFALPVLIVIFRLRSAYLAVGTWVVAEVVLLTAGKLPGFGFGAGAGLSVPVIRWFGSSAHDRYVMFYGMSLTLVLTATGLTWVLLRSATGLGLKAMRDNEEAAASIGVNLRRIRIICFLYTAPFLGLAGALITLQKGRISPLGSFSITEFTVYIVFIVVIGGIGSLEGPLAGAILFFVLREVLSDFGSAYLMLLGIVSILVILMAPRGLWGLMKDLLFKGDIFAVTHAPPGGVAGVPDAETIFNDAR